MIDFPRSRLGVAAIILVMGVLLFGAWVMYLIGASFVALFAVAVSVFSLVEAWRMSSTPYVRLDAAGLTVWVDPLLPPKTTAWSSVREVRQTGPWLIVELMSGARIRIGLAQVRSDRRATLIATIRQRSTSSVRA